MRRAAAEALGRLGVADPQVVNALRDALKDRYSDVRNAALDALWRISEQQDLWIGPDGEIRKLQ